MFGGIGKRLTAAKLFYGLSDLIDGELGSGGIPAFVVQDVMSKYYKLKSKGLSDTEVLNLVSSCCTEKECMKITDRLAAFSSAYYRAFDEEDGVGARDREVGEVFHDYIKMYDRDLKAGVFR